MAAAWKCGWCGLFGTMDPAGQYVVVKDGKGSSRIVHGVFTCAGCLGASIGVTALDSPVAPGLRSAGTDYWRDKTILEWRPQWVEGQDFPDVPDHIARAASEAHKSNSIANYMSAILMARTVIEATAKDKGVTKGTLFQKIDEMRNQDLIREGTKDAAHAIRDFGNDMAHGDIAAPISVDDAAEVLILMGEILAEVFQGPARTTRLKQAVQARKSATP